MFLPLLSWFICYHYWYSVFWHMLEDRNALSLIKAHFLQLLTFLGNNLIHGWHGDYKTTENLIFKHKPFSYLTWAKPDKGDRIIIKYIHLI